MNTNKNEETDGPYQIRKVRLTFTPKHITLQIYQSRAFLITWSYNNLIILILISFKNHTNFKTMRWLTWFKKIITVKLTTV